VAIRKYSVQNRSGWLIGLQQPVMFRRTVKKALGLIAKARCIPLTTSPRPPRSGRIFSKPDEGLAPAKGLVAAGSRFSCASTRPYGLAAGGEAVETGGNTAETALPSGETRFLSSHCALMNRLTGI
jgi:hypothetical protein